jgi:NifU-like protein involved in Fe-S cluster formation
MINSIMECWQVKKVSLLFRYSLEQSFVMVCMTVNFHKQGRVSIGAPALPKQHGYGLAWLLLYLKSYMRANLLSEKKREHTDVSRITYTDELKSKYNITGCTIHGPSPIPQEGEYGKVTDCSQISAFSHGCGTCAPQQGACKITLNVKDGVIQETLIEVVGCSGMTQSAAMAAEILPGCTLIEAVNTDLVCDAINVAMREILLQLIYGRSQTAFSKGGLPVGAGLDDLGPFGRSQLGTSYGTIEKGPRYLELTEGYVSMLGLDDQDRIIGYEFVDLGKMMKLIKVDGIDPAKALDDATGVYGRYEESLKKINPRKG